MLPLARHTVCVLVLAVAMPAFAQGGPAPTTEDTATARALFREGLELVDKKQWEQAADRFARVLDIRYSVVAAYNLATSLVELGALVEASEVLRAVMRDDAADASMRESARDQLGAIEKRIGKLRLEVSGDGHGVVITLDGRELTPAAWNVALPVDPGAHRVVAYRGERVIFDSEALVGEGGAREVVLPVELPASAPSPESAAATVAVDVAPLSGSHESPPDRVDDRDAGSMSWIWIGAGIVAAGALAALAVVIASDSSSKPSAPVSGDFEPGVLRGMVGAN